MPTTQPRIAVYLPKHVAATVRRCASLRGISRSALVAEILTEAQPVLERVSNLLDLAARTDRTALKQWAETLGEAQGSIEREATAALTTMASMEAALKGPDRPRRRRGGRTPGQ
jgi:hypothetical protein